MRGRLMPIACAAWGFRRDGVHRETLWMEAQKREEPREQQRRHTEHEEPLEVTAVTSRLRIPPTCGGTRR